jgi:2-iminoacetate synthase
MVAHARELEARFNIGPHTISFPRIEPANGTDLPEKTPWRVSDEDFHRIMVVTRLSVPYTGMIVTCRESPETRNRAVGCGITQMAAGSNIAIKGYSELSAFRGQAGDRQQFMLADSRSLGEVIGHLAGRGIITSFCTAGYRCGRTGGCIMDALKTGKEGKFCKVNAVLTFREWLDDFASPETRALCEPVLESELRAIEKELPVFYPAVKTAYEKICAGARDLFF